MNQETKTILELLHINDDFNFILDYCGNKEELETAIRLYHILAGIPNWDFEDDDSEGIDWICFDELWEALK